MYVGTLEIYNQTAMKSIFCPRQLTQAEKEASLFLNKHVKSENNSMFCGMYIVFVNGKLAENATMNLLSLLSITTKKNSLALLASERLRES